MAEVPPNAIPSQWREEVPARSPEELRSRRRRHVLLVLLTVLLAGGAGLALVLTRFRPVPHPHFVPLWVTEYSSPLLPPSTPGAADRESFQAADYFLHKSSPKWTSPDRATLRETLAALGSRPPAEPVVVYLSALAQKSGDAGVLLLPADADPLHLETALPLREVLEALAACPAREKLLVLDVMAPRTDARLGLIANDLGAAVQDDLRSVADPNRLVLCACSPGEVSLASEDLRRTVFGYYLEEGLRGAADGANARGARDRQVTVRELAAFVRARVGRWAWRNLRERQTPVLLGDAADFPLVALGKGPVPEPAPLAEPEPYPDWLRDAWKTRQRWWAEERYRLAPHLVLRIDTLLLETERGWRRGADTAALKAHVEAELSAWEKDYQRVLRLPPAPILALAPALDQGRKVDEFLVAAVRGEVNRLPSTAGADQKNADGAPRLSAGLLDKLKDQSTLNVALAAFRLAADDEAPRAERIRILNAIVQERESQPAFVETLLLRRLADLAAQAKRPWPSEAVRLALETATLGEKAAAQLRAFPWIRTLLEEAAQARYEGELLLLTGQGFAPLREADQAFKAATERYQSCLRRGEALEDAYRTLDNALAFLPTYTPYLEAVPERERAWQDAVESARALADRLSHPPAEWEAATALAGKLEKQLAALREPFTAEALASLRVRCSRPGAQAPVLREVNAVLESPHLAVEDRLSLWQAGRGLARRLDEAVLLLDREGGQPYEDPSADADVRQDSLQKEEWRRAAMRARASAALLNLAGLNTGTISKGVETFAGEIGRSQQTATGQRLEAALAETWSRGVPAAFQEGNDGTARDRMARVLVALDPAIIPRETESLPAVALRTRRSAEVASWRAERATYEAKDLENQGLLSPLLRRFYARQLAGFRPKSSTNESYVEVSTEPRQLRLTPETPAGGVTVKVRPHDAHPSEMTLRLLRPEGDALNLSPDLAAEPRLLSAGPAIVPVRVGVNLATAESALLPEGVLVQLRHRGRAYHSRLPVSARDVTDRVEILLGNTPQAPEVSLNVLALRPLDKPQPYYLFLRNPSPRTRKIGVELATGGAVLPGAQATLTLAGNETKLVSFTPSTPPAAAPPAAPTAGQKPSPELPELQGSLEVRLLDVEEKNQLLEVKTIRVEVASPRSYVEVVEARFSPPARDRSEPDGKNLLEISLRPTSGFTGPPCKAELVLPGVLGANKGTFRGELTAGGAALRLTAEDLRVTPGAAEDGSFSLTVDGVERAFVFRATFAAVGDPTTPRELTRPALRLRGSGYARPGDPRAVVIEVDNAPPGARLDVRLGKIVDGVFVAEVTRSLPSDRRRHIGFSSQGPAGVLLFEAAVADWTVPLDTSRIVGQRQLQVRLLDRDGGALQTVTQALTLDDGPPQNVRFLDPPRYARRGTTVTLKAAGTNSLAGIEKVLFFAGKPIDGKLPPDAETVAGRPLDAEKTTWAATLPVPKERTGPAEFGVQFITRTGVPEFKTVVVEVTDADPAKLTPGRIVGTVAEGSAAVAGLEVVLRDEKGVEKGRTTTADQGRFSFDGVLPGKYQLTAEKTKNPRRVGRANVTVVADQDAVAPIKLYLP